MKDHDRRIKLDQFLKWRNLVPTGGQAKWAIQDGLVKVNGEIETRRGRRLDAGDVVEVEGEEYEVEEAAPRPE